MGSVTRAQWLSGTKKGSVIARSILWFVCVSDCFYMTKLKIKSHCVIGSFNGLYGSVRLSVCVSVCHIENVVLVHPLIYVYVLSALYRMY